MPHIAGSDVKDCGGSVTITTQDWEAGTYIDYFLADDVNFDHRVWVQDRGLPDAISLRADQIMIDALNMDTYVKEFYHDSGKNLVDVFADCKCTIDGVIDDNPPIEGWTLLIPVAAQKVMFNDDKFMSSLYIQHQMNDIMASRPERFLGFDTLFIPNRKQGGLMYEELDDGKRK